MTKNPVILGARLRTKKSKLDSLLEIEKEIQERMDSAINSIDAAESDEDLNAVEKEIEEIEKELEEKKAEEKQLEEEINQLESDLEEINNKTPKNNTDDRGGKKSMSNRTKEELEEYREAANEYLRSKGENKRDGLKSDDVGVLIPKDIDYIPRKDIDSTTDLAQFVTVLPVKNASGTYYMQKRSKAKMHTVAELQENPDLAKPEFIPVDWKVETYRGMIAISQESIDDTEADLVAIVNDNAEEQRENTSNDLITQKFQSFTKIEIDASTEHIVDKIKEILNVKLDPAYEKSFIVTQSFFQVLDTLKDKTGKYLLQPDITGASDGLILNKPVHIVLNEQLEINTGTEESPVIESRCAFIGDSKRAALMAKRAEISAKWADDKIYGEYVATGIRFGISTADKDAGYFVCFKNDVPAG